MSLSVSVSSLLCLLLLMIYTHSPFHSASISSTARAPLRKPRLFKPLIGEDGKIYTCSSERSLLAFESNGSISWSVPLGFQCNARLSPIRDDVGKIYVVAENRVLEINPRSVGTPKSAVQVFFGPEPGQESPGEIIGHTVSTLSSSVIITVGKRGLFSYARPGKLIWSVGPVLQRFGYRQGCRRGHKDCYFASVPVIDQCEASIYIWNTQGELYSLSILRPYFKWIQDLSSFGEVFTVTAGNSGHLYVTVPVKALLLALDVSSGTILWQRSIGPLSTAEYEPVVDSNGWISIGSLDGFLYSFSPDGMLKKYKKIPNQESVFQVSPLLDCSGFAIYVSQTKMEGKISNTVGEYTYVSAMRPISVVFMLLVPATGAFYWSESYPGAISSFISETDLQRFVFDEEILLAFLTASKTGNPLKCRTTGQKISSSCSKTESKQISIFTGSERATMLFLLFETAVLILLAGAVRFCCIFWRKKKIQGKGLGSFLQKRRSLRQRKRAHDATIRELELKASSGSKALEDLGDMVREREAIERKLSTAYSLGRDGHSKPILPVFDRDTTDTSSSSTEETGSSSGRDNEGKAINEAESSSDDDEVASVATTSSRGHGGRSLLQRRALSSIN